MGRYSVPLAPEFATFAGVGTGQRALDVGCGAGALTTELVGRLDADAVTAVDHDRPFGGLREMARVASTACGKFDADLRTDTEAREATADERATRPVSTAACQQTRRGS